MKQFIFFFIIFKFYYGNYVHNMKIITFPFLHSFDFTFDMIKVKIVLKNDKIVYSSLSLFQDFTFIKNENYTFLRNETYENSLNNVFNLYEEYVQIGDNNISLKFYGEYSNVYVTNKNDYGNRLSFYHRPKLNTTNIVLQLYDSNMIDSPIFGINFNHGRSGNIFIGGIPPNIINKKPLFDCNVIGNDWDCLLTEIFFGEKNNKSDSIKLKIKALINPTVLRIKIPSFIFTEIIRKNIFKNVNQTRCSLVDTIVHCSFGNAQEKEKFYNSIPPNINFVLGNYIVTVSVSSLFNEADTLLIESSQENEVVFSHVFLKHFISVFDYTKDKITFYLNEENEKIISISQEYEDKFIKIKQLLFFISSIILCLGIIIFIPKIRITLANKEFIF